MQHNDQFKSLRFVILFGWLLLNNLFAQTDEVNFEHISLEQGLSQSTIFCILQDSKGFMWFGTANGLNKYDGYHFTVYTHNPLHQNSLSNDYINAIFEDKSGVLWIGTKEGLNQFDREKEQFTRYLHDPSNPKSISGNFIFTIYEDKSGTLWVGTATGLNRLGRETDTFRHYPCDPNNPYSLSSNAVRAIYEDRFGNLWIGTVGGGLDRLVPSTSSGQALREAEELVIRPNSNGEELDRGKEQVIHYKYDPENPNSLSSNYVRTIYEDKSENLWIGTKGGGLNLFDRENESFVHFKHDPNDPNSVNSNIIWSICEDRLGGLWIGTDAGLNELDHKNKKFKAYRYDPANSTSISTNKVMSIYEDKTGILWVGTVLGGLNKLNRAKNKFSYYKHDPFNSSSLNDDIVYSFHEDKQGILWIGTWEGLNKLDRKNGTFSHYKPNAKIVTQFDNVVLSIDEDKYGNLWIGAWGTGVHKFDRNKNKFTHVNHYLKNSNRLSDNNIWTVYADKSGTLWVGTEGGLNKIDLQRNSGQAHNKFEVRHYKHIPSSPNCLSHNFVRAIYEDKSGNLWIGTHGGGLNQFDPATERFVSYKHDPTNPNSLSHNNVNSIYEDNSGILWIGTYGGGLNRFEPQTGRFTYFTEENGLCNNVVYGMMPDDNGNFWLSTNKGITKFGLQTLTIRNYDISDGLQSNEFNTGAYYKNKSGEMFFGGINGFNSFHPDSIRDNLYPPQIMLTDFKVFNKSITVGSDDDSALKKHISAANEVILSYKQNFFPWSL